jgi:hypothetical protein
MPTKKQRRRQLKSRRHEYEYVYVDDEGNEVAVDPGDLRAEKDDKKTETRVRRTGAGRSGPRNQRVIQPPSWRRAARRAVIFGPVLVVAMMLLNRNVAPLQWITSGIFLIAFFVPISYFTDSLAYRMYRKRIEQRGSPKAR